MQQPREPLPVQQVRLFGCFAMSLMLLALCLLMFFFEFAKQALENLHLSPEAAILVLLGSLVGSAINIPVARFPLDEEVLVPVFDVIGWELLPRYRRVRREAVVAVNVGGCVVPVLLAAWLMRFIIAGGPQVIVVTLVGIAANSAICYALARPVPKLGISLPGFVPALVALGVTWVGLMSVGFREYYAPVAFVIGISGPLIGADLLHWKDFKKIAAGTISIGGAGTWDGIVLSGLLAAFVAGTW